MRAAKSRKSVLLLLTSVLVLSLGALVVPTFIRARTTSALNVCVNNLHVIAAAKEQWAIEYGRAPNDVPTWEHVRPYLKEEKIPLCPGGGAYTLKQVGEAPGCSIGGLQHSLDWDDAKERRFSAVAGLLALLSCLGLFAVLLLPEKVQDQGPGSS